MPPWPPGTRPGTGPAGRGSAGPGAQRTAAGTDRPGARPPEGSRGGAGAGRRAPGLCHPDRAGPGMVISKNIEPGEYVAAGHAGGHRRRPGERLAAGLHRGDRPGPGQGGPEGPGHDRHLSRQDLRRPGVVHLAPRPSSRRRTCRPQKERVKLVYRIKIDIANPDHGTEAGHAGRRGD